MLDDLLRRTLHILWNANCSHSKLFCTIVITENEYMGQPDPVDARLEAKECRLREANAQATNLLRQTIGRLLVTVQDEPIMQETPLEVRADIDFAIEDMHAALRFLESAGHGDGLLAAQPSDGPTPSRGSSWPSYANT
ncbi:MAG: hypothetical protein IPI02_20285 [Sterolibacteriaceae bacterium]|nr:hypothetical protein [Sterolibacteriaceae bacterium]